MCTCVHVCTVKCVCVVIDGFYTNLAYQRSSDRWRSSASYISPRQHSAVAAPFCPDHSSPSAEQAKQHCTFQHHTTWHFRWQQQCLFQHHTTQYFRWQQQCLFQHHTTQYFRWQQQCLFQHHTTQYFRWQQQCLFQHHTTQYFRWKQQKTETKEKHNQTFLIL